MLTNQGVLDDVYTNLNLRLASDQNTTVNDGELLVNPEFFVLAHKT